MDSSDYIFITFMVTQPLSSVPTTVTHYTSESEGCPIQWEYAHEVGVLKDGSHMARSTAQVVCHIM